MDVIIAGSRSINKEEDKTEIVGRAIESTPFDIEKVIHGGAKGVDSIAEELSQEHFELKTEIYPAEWEQFGDAAGPKRNREMAKDADALIAIWDGDSSGTRNMINEALKHGLEIFVHNFSDDQISRNQTTITETV